MDRNGGAHAEFYRRACWRALGLGQGWTRQVSGPVGHHPHSPARLVFAGRRRYRSSPRGFFIFLFFYFRFLQKYIFVFEIYRNIPRPPRCRAAGTWSTRCGAAGAFVQKLLRKYLCAGPWGRSPGLLAPQAARQRGGRPWPPGYRATGSKIRQGFASLPPSLFFLGY